MELTLITAELSAKTVYFFQCCGADMGITSSRVLNRLLLEIPEKTPVAAAKLTMEHVTNQIKYLRDYSYTNQDVLDNINFIKESQFYKEKFANNEIL